MVPRHLTLAAVALLVALFAGVAMAETYEVQMTTENFEPRFIPADLAIRPGDTVRWTNTDPFLDHSTVSGTGSADPAAGSHWNSGILTIGEYFEHTFEEAGDYEYFSLPHEVEGMFGVVRVSSSTSVGGSGVQSSTWGKIKKNFSLILPKE